MAAITRRHLLLAASLVAPFAARPALAQEKIKAVATFSILADLVRNVGGERAEVATLVGPNGEVHVYSPSPADARMLHAARLVVVNGLGLEGWMTRLVEASATTAAIAIASTGFKARRMADSPQHSDPHAWHAVANAEIYVGNIRDGLIKADPQGRAVYDANAAAYLAKLAVLDREIREAIGRIPPDRCRVITSHDSFGYFGDAYGVQFIAPEGVSAEPSARDLARIIRQIRTQRIPALFLENVSDPRVIRQIAKETGARIGGTLYSDALSGPDGPAATYIDLMRSNVRALVAALAP